MDITPFLTKLQPHFAELAIPQNPDEWKRLKVDPIYKKDLDCWNSNIKAQQFCLELLTNICSSEGESDIGIPIDVLKYISSSGIIQKLLIKCWPPNTEIIEILKKFNLTSIYEQLTVIQIRALNCLGNVLLVLQPIDLGDISPVWNFLCQLCATDSPSLELFEAISSGMWTIMRKYPRFEPNVTQLEGIFQLAKNSPFSEVRTNTIGILGILGQQPKLTGSLMDFATLLLHSLNDTSIFVINEALNSIFDIFAETEHNQLIQKLEMLPKLLKCLQSLRSKKGNSLMEEDTMLSLEEAEENLTRFMEYKYQQFK